MREYSPRPTNKRRAKALMHPGELWGAQGLRCYGCTSLVKASPHVNEMGAKHVRPERENKPTQTIVCFRNANEESQDVEPRRAPFIMSCIASATSLLLSLKYSDCGSLSFLKCLCRSFSSSW